MICSGSKCTCANDFYWNGASCGESENSFDFEILDLNEKFLYLKLPKKSTHPHVPQLPNVNRHIRFIVQ
jgi:hypothetical protein